MNPSSFQQSKKDILSRPDKSFIFGIDVRIKKLCNKINSLENYYTTSSCSGRIVVMVEQKQKGPDLFLFVSHEKISFRDLKKELEKITFPPTRPSLRSLHSQINGSNSDIRQEFSLNEKNVNGKKLNKRGSTVNSKIKMIKNLSRSSVINFNKNRASSNERAKLIKNSLIKFKFDPCILHIVCKDMKSADELLKKAQFCGWKKSGLLNFGRKIVVELNSTERLEFPIIKNGKVLVDNEFLKLIVEESNKKIELGWEKIKKLEFNF